VAWRPRGCIDPDPFRPTVVNAQVRNGVSHPEGAPGEVGDLSACFAAASSRLKTLPFEGTGILSLALEVSWLSSPSRLRSSDCFGIVIPF
jgi:hypothetical protein